MANFFELIGVILAVLLGLGAFCGFLYLLTGFVHWEFQPFFSYETMRVFAVVTFVSVGGK